tara:strand:+ start:392 stop:778 length:387 start_codon:yes stop_codon:yes gene_type:complete
MRTIIITINILLLSLILYNFLLRGDKLIENLENCDAENALTAKINNTYNILDRIKKKKNEATSMVKNSISLILFSGKVHGKSQSKLNDKKDKEMDKINKAGGEMDDGDGGSKYIEPDDKLGKALSGGL